MDLTYTERGFLAPRISDTNNIVAPANGLSIYLTSESVFYYFDGLRWNKIAAGIGINGLTSLTGRIINVLYLILNGLLENPILYLSAYIIDNKVDYYRLLQEVRTKNNW